jgi:hypothetical protein
MKNKYTCDECKGSIITIDREEGVTPYALACRATDGCQGTMTSAFYLCDQNLIPGWEWYKPANLKGLNAGTREHVEHGGLLLQRIPANPHNIDDPLLRRVVVFIEGREYLSASDLQRQYRCTYMTAARLLDELVTRNFIEAGKDKKGRHQVIKRASKGVEVYADQILTS